jgi:hypothetical protein
MNWASGETKLSNKATDIYLLQCLPRNESPMLKDKSKKFDLKISSEEHEKPKG